MEVGQLGRKRRPVDERDRGPVAHVIVGVQVVRGSAGREAAVRRQGTLLHDLQHRPEVDLANRDRNADVLQHLGHGRRHLVEALAVVLRGMDQREVQHLARAIGPALRRVLPSRFGEQRARLLRIERIRFLLCVPGGHGRDRRRVVDRVAVEDLLDDPLAVDRHVHREADAGVREEPVLAAGLVLVFRPAVQIQPAHELLRARQDLQAGLARDDARIQRRYRLDDVHLPGAERGETRRRFRDDLEAQPANERSAAPVLLVAFERQVVLALPLDDLPRPGAVRLVVERVDAVRERVRLRHERLAADEVPERRRRLAGVDPHGVGVDFLPARDVRVDLLERRGRRHVLHTELVELAPEEAVEVEEHAVRGERLAVVERDPLPQGELPREVVDRLPRERQPGHGAALRVDVDEALVHLADVVRADRAHADARIHVGRVVGERDDELGVGIDRDAVQRGSRRVRGGARLRERDAGRGEHHCQRDEERARHRIHPWPSSLIAGDIMLPSSPRSRKEKL